MCNVKEGPEVKTKADLQNLVTSVLLRQKNEFTLDDIIQGANARLVGSAYFESKELEECCKNTLNTLFNINSIRSVSKGKWKLTMSWPAVSGK